MNEKEEEYLVAFEHLIDMVGKEDYHLIHNTVRNLVADGDVSEEFEKKYSEMIDRKLCS